MRGEGREGLKVERCTLHVGRQRGGAQRRCARTGSGSHGERREARGARREGMRCEGREGLKVERCTLHVGRQRGGAQRRCARTGYGGGGGARREARGERREGMRREV